MPSRYSIRNCSSLRGKGVYIDANVIIYLFWPSGRFSYEDHYARGYGQLIRQENQLYTSWITISEVVNRALRIEYKKINSPLHFKEFRDSKEGREVQEDVYTIVDENILSQFEVVEKSFDKHDIQSSLFVDELDFVDKAIVQICDENDLVLLTNDRDFRHTSIDTLSGHRDLTS